MTSIRVALTLAGLISLLSLAAVGAEPNAESGGEAPALTAPFPRCRDVGPILADPERYRDAPIYVENEQPTGRLMKWARSKPGYAGIWIDREHLGWVTLMFTEDVEQRQAELRREFPGVGSDAGY